MNWVLLTKLPDLIQRDSLVFRLGQEQIEVMAPDRDMIIDVGGGPNLTLGGYSALFDGYSVLVQKKDLSKAQDILKDFEPVHLQESPLTPDYMNKFYYSSVLSVFAPVLLHVTALYHLFKSIQTGQFQFSLKFFMALFLFILTLTVVIYAILA